MDLNDQRKVAEAKKDHFWRYKLFTSERQRFKIKNGVIIGKSQGHSGWTGPFYFENPVNCFEVRDWIRDHLRLEKTKHIALRTSKSLKLNSLAMNSHFSQLKIQLEIGAGFRKSRIPNHGNPKIEKAFYLVRNILYPRIKVTPLPLP